MAEDWIKEPGDRGCDVKSWSGACEHTEYTKEGDQYLCSTCGKIAKMTQQVHHEHFPHVSGDTDNMY